MALRLLPWALFAAAVAALSLFTPAAEEAAPVPASEREAAALDLTVRLSPLDLREFHDGGGWNRLEAEEAVYSYGGRTVTGTGVTFSLGKGRRREDPSSAPPARSGISTGTASSCRKVGARSARAAGGGARPRPDRPRHPDPAGAGRGDADRARPVRRRREPGVELADGKIRMDSPVSRIAPASLPGRRG
jgi:hypothetical protein